MHCPDNNLSRCTYMYVEARQSSVYPNTLQIYSYYSVYRQRPRPRNIESIVPVRVFLAIFPRLLVSKGTPDCHYFVEIDTSL